MKLRKEIIDTVEAIKGKSAQNVLVRSKHKTSQSNEFLFIIKPEVFARVKAAETKEMVSTILDYLAAFDISIDNIRVINAAYLKEHNVISNHYGIINEASRDIKSLITEEIEDNFTKHYKLKIGGEIVFGSLEYKKHFPELTDADIAKLWGETDIKRLASGVYAGKVNIEGKEAFLINGFHPAQLNHFIENDRVIVTMNLSGDLNWTKARQKFIGNTYPEKADEGTLRRRLFKDYQKLGFDDVSYVINCVHLSAGPLEGMLEIERFNSTPETPYSINDTVFGKMLSEKFPPAKVQDIISNPLVKYNNEIVSLFDLTEEVNAEKAIELIKEARFNYK